MAIHGAARWKPSIYRTALEATLTDFDPSASPPSGTIVRTAQLVAYDDAVVTGANYKPGDPTTERSLVVLDQGAIEMDLAAFDAMTAAQADAAWAQALQQWGQARLAAGTLLVKALWGSQFAPPVVLA